MSSYVPKQDFIIHKDFDRVRRINDISLLKTKKITFSGWHNLNFMINFKRRIILKLRAYQLYRAFKGESF